MPKFWVIFLSFEFFFLEFWVTFPWVFFSMAKNQAWSKMLLISFFNCVGKLSYIRNCANGKRKKGCLRPSEPYSSNQNYWTRTILGKKIRKHSGNRILLLVDLTDLFGNFLSVEKTYHRAFIASSVPGLEFLTEWMNPWRERKCVVNSSLWYVHVRWPLYGTIVL